MEGVTLIQRAWDDSAEAAFMAAYNGDAGHVQAHREDVEAGREVLFSAGDFGMLTCRFEPVGGIVLTGAAGYRAAFKAVLATLEANFPLVFVETFRPGLVDLLAKEGYALDHVRMFKRVQ